MQSENIMIIWQAKSIGYGKSCIEAPHVTSERNGAKRSGESCLIDFNTHGCPHAIIGIVSYFMTLYVIGDMYLILGMNICWKIAR